MSIFKSRNRLNQFDLNIKGQTGGNAVWIIFTGFQAFRFKKYLMGIPVRETMNLVLYRWAITWTDPFNYSGKQWTSVQTRPDDIVRFNIGIGNPAR